MKFSYRWLAELVPGLDSEPSQLERLITIRTAECEGIEQIQSDWIVDIDNKSLTHRPDLWGHIGMAREVAAITGRTLQDPVKLHLLPPGASPVRVAIEDYALCPRYSALLLENLAVNPAQPWMQQRLESVGLNSINNIVDVTNYVLAELPQPMHAFDADKLAGDTIYVRLARPGERLRALNGETYHLSAEDLVIADASGPIALGGVIGGAATAISESTTRVVLESANFNATRVRLTSARHKLRTDASVRFEKALDPENTVRGLARALELLSPARPVGGVADNRSHAKPIPLILLPIDFVTRKLGIEVPAQRISAILSALGFTVAASAPGMLTVTVPTWRATKDISLKDDLVEEIGRMIGYDAITPAAPLVEARVPPPNPLRMFLRNVRSQLAAQGFTEAYNYSFLNESDARRFSLDIATHLAVQNPIASELTHLRRSLLPGLFKNILDNVRHYPAFRIFEIGHEIHPQASGLPHEVTHAAAAIYDAHGDEQDFFELKRVLECVFAGARLTAAEARAYEHPARTAEIRCQDALLGRIFELHPLLLQQEGIEGRAVFFDVNLDLAQQLASARAPKYIALRRYPTSGFDLSVVSDLRTLVDRIQAALAQCAGPHLAAIEFIRQYDGPPLPPGQKSVSYHLEVGALDHTLSADEATDIRSRIIEGMRALGYELRV
ncbi:MAG TPA: phenylalanine--tRNA ligase subunit beta [Bryobacteraceae bacterium]|jgi:phenylalanyl-tRNA synthetase beta chain|nr:phenylalanine--tRNA ligase subunit beta [Bryobacteraceae bacterium]